ncbi:uncharacterized protein KY384_005530 [Bacidia gigantensis]|uniref:uncharacterized protein n=1 Tax=Bacidia gigantensis TaxID=2732470 RepID=UPI001D037306|nr:uncharacterized protein KY384_005530 [Bacidia gigantensis]KAG8530048.1 hypothetical protein KY384_005530 [Bacidia gigantensis]
MAQDALTQPAGVRKSGGRPKKSTKKAGRPRKNEVAPKSPTKQRRRPAATKATANNVTASAAPAPAQARAKKPAQSKEPVTLNERSYFRLNVFVCGEGSNSELGLGPSKRSIDVKRPRLNRLLDPSSVEVVTVGAGGMHVAVGTAKGNVLTWGVNDNGALGRDTEWDGGMKDVDEESESDEDQDDSGLNPKECTPAQVELPEDVTIAKVSAGDSHTLALTDDGNVYGWGTFRNSSGILGFYQDPSFIHRRDGNTTGKGFIFTQNTPRLYVELKDIVDIKSGANFAMALTAKGLIYIWGCGEQNQLGRHINERIDVESKGCLAPSLLRTGHKKFRAIFNGADHAFAIDSQNKVWSWGLNSFGATGISNDAGKDRATVYTPTLVKSLNQDPTDPVIFLCGGQHHSIAVTESGTPFVFGRIDGFQAGIDPASFPDSDVIKDESGNPRILIKPTEIPNVGKVKYAACGTDHSLVIDDEGHIWTWGISVTYQTGQGTEDDVEQPTKIQTTATSSEQFIWCGAGGQYSMFASVDHPGPIPPPRQYFAQKKGANGHVNKTNNIGGFVDGGIDPKAHVNNTNHVKNASNTTNANGFVEGGVDPMVGIITGNNEDSDQAMMSGGLGGNVDSEDSE